VISSVYLSVLLAAPATMAEASLRRGSKNPYSATLERAR
jgi:hypothetical protein